MKRLLAFAMFGMLAMTALIGCRVEGEVGDAATNIVVPR